MYKLLFLLLLISQTACSQTSNKANTKNNTMSKNIYYSTTNKEKVVVPDSVWKQILSPEVYAVARQKGTERPFSGEYYNHFQKGKYVCAGCENDLFTSETKFDSHCGWPSFDKAIKGSVIYKDDLSFGMVRTEVMCANCGGHLGHVFDDGPAETTGKRYCTNSVSIKFIPANPKK